MVITYEVRTFALAFGPQGGLVKAEEIFERMTEEGNSARSGACGGFSPLLGPGPHGRGKAFLGGGLGPPWEEGGTPRRKKKKKNKNIKII